MASIALACRNRRITFPRRPLVMGIVNLNDDSFCGDGTLDTAKAVEMTIRMICEGADIIDAGAESARTNRQAISANEEIDRLLPFLSALPDFQSAGISKFDETQLWPPLISVNTWRPEVVEAVLASGKVDIVNDLSALPDDRNARLCAEHRAALLIMHSAGRPKEPHDQVSYDDVLESILTFFEEKIDLATAAGLPGECVILDPGIDFAKQRDDNLTIFRELKRIVTAFQRPVLLPVSRKTVIGEVLGIADPSARDAGTIACIAAGVERGAHLFRVHNVAAAVQSVKVLEAVRNV